ncbi:hypothetical protein BDZ97DRAFT_1764797 [Flammula alnicola]|nr:hypothetical protein BDZ97DRAFT_1764797 [Flammula alnicola]
MYLGPVKSSATTVGMLWGLSLFLREISLWDQHSFGYSDLQCRLHTNVGKMCFIPPKVVNYSVLSWKSRRFQFPDTPDRKKTPHLCHVWTATQRCSNGALAVRWQIMDNDIQNRARDVEKALAGVPEIANSPDETVSGCIDASRDGKLASQSTNIWTFSWQSGSQNNSLGETSPSSRTSAFSIAQSFSFENGWPVVTASPASRGMPALGNLPALQARDLPPRLLWPLAQGLFIGPTTHLAPSLRGCKLSAASLTPRRPLGKGSIRGTTIHRSLGQAANGAGTSPMMTKLKDFQQVIDSQYSCASEYERPPTQPQLKVTMVAPDAVTVCAGVELGGSR